MLTLKKFALSAASASLLLAACGGGQIPGGQTQAGTKAPARAADSRCQQVFGAVAAGASVARVDPRLPMGQPYGMVLVFQDGADMSEVESRLRRSQVLSAAEIDSLFVLRNLEQVFVDLDMVSLELIEGLRDELDGLPLISFWGNHPQRLMLDTSHAGIGNDAQFETFGLTGKGIGVAVIDSGIDTTQGDFENVVFNSKFDGVDYTVQTPNSDSSSGHGTHVAGTVGGTGVASSGRFKGVAPGASLLGFGTGDAILVVNAASARAYDLVLDDDFREQYNIRVTNNSYGPLADPETGEAPPFDPAGSVAQATYQMYLKGVINVFAAGNDGPGQRTNSPYAASPCNIGVGMGNREGGLDPGSSRGVSDDPTYDIDITAPGVSITATRATSGAVTAPRPDFEAYSTISGTSMATPHVAGAVALMLEANPDLSFEEVLDILQSTATPMRADQPQDGVERAVGEPYALWEAGPGMMNISAAVASVLGMPAPPLRYGRFDGSEDGLLGRWAGLAGFIVGDPTGLNPVFGRVNPCLCGVFDRSYVVDMPASGTLQFEANFEFSGEDWRMRVFGPEPGGEMLAEARNGGSDQLKIELPGLAAGTYRAVLSEMNTSGSRISVEARYQP